MGGRTVRRAEPAEVAIVHDYLTQRGGAERVVLAMADAFPHAAIHTSLYDPDGTFPRFAAATVRTSGLDRVGALRRNHRMALPLLAPAFSRMVVDARVAVCSSSGWAHGARTTGRTVVYCHTPARWLYQADRYLGGGGGGAAAALRVLGPPLRRWDRRAAGRADRYLVNATVVRDRVREVYGIDPEVLHPPMTFPVLGPETPVAVPEGYFLAVARLLPYKGVAELVEAFRDLPFSLAIAGGGPMLEQLRASAPTNVTVLGRVDDEQLRWLYANSRGLVAPSHEDFGLTPVEAAAFGKPTAALRWGGFLDTIVEGDTGTFFDEVTAAAIVAAVRRLAAEPRDPEALRAHAAEFSAAAFGRRLRQVVAEELAVA